MTCPFCGRGFTTASGVSHHLETASCPKARGVDRKIIYEQLRRRDRQGILTNKLLEWHEETWDTGNAWNGYRFECYLCHKEFNTYKSLDQHLESPAHQQNLYHCPNPKCRMHFKTLAAIFNHLESESCAFIKFAAVKENVNRFFSNSQARIAFY